MTMTIRERRGAKLKCQNEDCALPFYDLNRASVVCPNCGAAYVPQVASAPAKSSKRNFFPKLERPVLQVAPDEADDEREASENDNDFETAEEDLEDDTKETAPGISILVPDEIDVDPAIDIGIDGAHPPLKDD